MSRYPAALSRRRATAAPSKAASRSTPRIGAEYALSAYDSVIEGEIDVDWAAMAEAALELEFSAGTPAVLPEGTAYVRCAPAPAEPNRSLSRNLSRNRARAALQAGARYVTLSFETRGGSELDELRVPVGTAVDLAKYVSERRGFDFAGWYPDEGFMESIDEIHMNRDRTVYAGWEPFDDRRAAGLVL